MFNTKEEFKKFLQLRYYNPDNILDEDAVKERREKIISAWEKEIYINPNSELAKLYLDSFKNEINHDYSPKKPQYNKVVELLFDDICNALPKDIAKIINEKIVITSVDTKFINASVHVSPCKKYYGIIINSSMIELLHKIGKISIARINPKAIVYCSRHNVSEITEKIMHDMYFEYFDNFKNTRRCYGPVIHLREEENVKHITNLQVAELFIICHELGHIINGDFNDLNLADHFLDYIEEPNHRKEYMADIIGFFLMLITLEKGVKFDQNYRLNILFNIIHLIDLLYTLQNKETKSHPNPIKRAFCISDHYYGESWTELIEKSYENIKILERAIEDQPEIDSIEKDISEILFTWIRALWEK